MYRQFFCNFFALERIVSDKTGPKVIRGVCRASYVAVQCTNGIVTFTGVKNWTFDQLVTIWLSILVIVAFLGFRENCFNIFRRRKTERKPIAKLTSASFNGELRCFNREGENPTRTDVTDDLFVDPFAKYFAVRPLQFIQFASPAGICE